jgi:hypothetical protein
MHHVVNAAFPDMTRWPARRKVLVAGPTSILENVTEKGLCLGLFLGRPAIAGVG